MIAKKRSIAVIVGIIIILPLAAYASRGWFRITGVNSYNSIFYKHSVDQAYERGFSPINDQLHTVGITFTNPKTSSDGCGQDGDSYFTGFHIDSFCSKYVATHPISITSQFITKWHLQALQLKASLDTGGWKGNTPLSNSEFARVFDKSNLGASVQFSKQIGHVECDVTISTDSPDSKLFSYESCSREINYFGGA